MDVFIESKAISLQIDTKACLRIEQEGRLRQRIPLRELGSVMMATNVTLSSKVLQALAEHRVPVLMLPGRHQSQALTVQGPAKGSIRARMLQHRCYASPQARTRAAAQLVQAKLNAVEYAGCVLRQQTTSAGQIAFSAEELSAVRARLLAAESVDTVRGIEGAFSRRWFEVLRAHLMDNWGFQQRQRRPPADPVNALLSLSYMLALGDINAAVQWRGLDVELGYLHDPLAGRPSLSLDLLEAVRPLIDLFVWSLLQGDYLTTDDFYYEKAQGCRLRKQAWGVYMSHWLQWKQQPVTPSQWSHGLKDYQGRSIDFKDKNLRRLAFLACHSLVGYLRELER